MQQFQKWFGLIVMIVLLLAIPLAVGASGGDDEAAFDWKGTLDSRPAGVEGTWVIDGREFQATSATTLEEEYHALEVGSCAKVEYNVEGAINVAVKIQDEDASHCSNDGGGDDSQHVSLYARLDSAPPADIYNGEWSIGGTTYTSNSNTAFDFSEGTPVAGTCVEVEYDPATPTVLHALSTESDYKCNTGGGSDDESHMQVYGILDAFPAALTGTWTVSGTNYIADTTTRFEQEHGGFFVGVCVKVKFDEMTNGDKKAVEISAEDAYHCGGSGNTSAEEKLYALIDTVPANYETAPAEWTIGGATFSGDPATTEFEQEHGNFAAGVCAEVEYYSDNGTKVATKIGTEELYKCNTNTFTNEVYGTVVTRPDGLYGSWVISSTHVMSQTYNAGAYTEFDPQDSAAYPAGQCVKVKFFVENGVNKASKIEAESVEHCGGSDGSETPSLPGHSKVYALLDSFPGGGAGSMNLGEWVIGGETYTATAETRYHTEHGDFAAGVCVKAKYYVNTDGNKILRKVSTENPEKCRQHGSNADEFKGYGVIEAMPSVFSSPGTWTISGIDYETTPTTKYEQEHGFFSLGTFVEVKYIIVSGIKTALGIETHVAPDAGTGSVTGSLDGQPDLDGDGWDDWQVDGKDYYSDHAIEVDAALLGGSSRVSVAGQPTVKLNTYLGIDGKTYVTSASEIHQIYLPLLLR